MAKKFTLNQIEAGDRSQPISAASNQRAETAVFWRSAEPGTSLKWEVRNKNLPVAARYTSIRSFTS